MPLTPESEHTLLVIDAGRPDCSPLFTALRETQSRASGCSHRLFFHTLSDVTETSGLQALLGLDQLTSSTDEYTALTTIRAVAVHWTQNDLCADTSRIIRQYYPNIPIHVICEESHAAWICVFFAEEKLGDIPSFYPSFSTLHRTASEIHQRMDSVIADQYETPYWNSLRKYAERPVISFHALPIGQGRSLSSSLTDFAHFYGTRHFTAETSLSTSPLDSLLNPHSAIAEAQLKAARAFGASVGMPDGSRNHGTRFVTNGTSTANKVVLCSHVRPDDYVVMDRSCHISHHEALALAHARPFYIDAFTNVAGISGAVPAQFVADALDHLLRNENRLPAAVILNNPTFDGIFCRPAEIISKIHDALSSYWQDNRGTKPCAELIIDCKARYPSAASDLPVQIRTEKDFKTLAFRCMVFLFDEAWSAFAYFHPRFIEVTAMHSAWSLGREHGFNYTSALRVYATQSTHKSLSALRQGSMIHYRDPLMAHPEIHQVFEQSFRAHSTTSPSASIIASLDVARRQAELEGVLLIDRCVRLAQQFREDFSKTAMTNDPGRLFYVVDETEMLQSAEADYPDLRNEDFRLDPTRVTLSWRGCFSGRMIRQMLLDKSIQMNKYDRRSILAIFNIGTNLAAVTSLAAALNELSEKLIGYAGTPPDCGAPSPALPRFRGLHNQNNLGFWFHNQGRLKIDTMEIGRLVQLCAKDEREDPYLAATFVTPYPPGYPILVPGQVINVEDLEFLLSLKNPDIHGTELIDGRLHLLVFCRDPQ